MTGTLEAERQDRGIQFAELVRRAISRSKRHNHTSVAKGMQMPYQSFYNRVQGITPFSANEIRRLIAVIPDPSLVSYLLQGTPYVAAERLDAEPSSEEEALLQAVHRVIYEASDVLSAVDEALKDKRIDHRDTAVIIEQVEDAERSLISLREYFTRSRT